MVTNLRQTLNHASLLVVNVIQMHLSLKYLEATKIKEVDFCAFAEVARLELDELRLDVVMDR